MDKLKAWFSMLSTKTAEWIKIMKPKLEKVRNYATAGSFQYEIHAWNSSYLTTTMVDAARHATEQRRTTLEADLRAIEKRLGPGRNSDSDAQNDRVEEEEGKRDEAVIKLFASKLNVSNVDDATELWKDVELVAKGDSLEKKSVSIKPIMDNMISAIESYDDTRTRFVNLYDKHLAALNKANASVKRLGNTAVKNKDKAVNESAFDILNEKASKWKNKKSEKKGNDKKPKKGTSTAEPETQEQANAAAESEAEKDTNTVSSEIDKVAEKGDSTDIADLVRAFTRDVSRFESHLNSLKTKNTTWLKEMAQEYMSALAKFSTIKDTA